MSKRKPKKRKKHPASSSPAPDVPQATSSPSWFRSQRGLLLVAVALLGSALLINFQRFRQSQIPTPLPLPTRMVTERPLRALSQPSGSTRFSRLSPEQTGITFAHPVIPDHPMAHLYFSAYASGGTAIGDLNGDNRPDIFIASGPRPNALYLQSETSLKFVDATESSGINASEVWSAGATMADVNADGRLDIFVANYGAPNQLFINLGDGRFQDRAADYNLNMTDASLAGAFADYDLDGDLDLYLLTYRYENPDGIPAKPPIVFSGGRKKIHPDFENYYELTNDSVGYGPYGRWDSLLQNNGDGTFTNVSLEAGIRGPGHGQSATWWDFNSDGYPDIYVGNDFNDPDRLYRNNGDGTFTDVVSEQMPHVTWFSMGADVGDLDGDGLLDLVSTDMSSTTHFKQKTTMGAMGTNAEFLAKAVPRQYMRNTVLMNTQVNRFREAAYLTEFDSTDWTWAVKLGDYDCDGLVDAFFTNGSVRSFTDSDLVLSLSQRQGKTEWDIYKDTEPLREKNLAFQNRGEFQFDNQSEDWGLDHLGVSMSAAQGDLDGDGDLDLVVAHVDEPLTIYRNDTKDQHRITLRLHGRQQNRFASGAVVTVRPDNGRKQTKLLQPSRGFLSSDEPLLHFGCGSAQQVDITIRWPDGSEQQLDGLKTDRHYDIVQAADLPKSPPTASPTPLFRTDAVPLASPSSATPPSKEALPTSDSPLPHRENTFDDYALQPLLPHRMSALGPGLATGDVDGDGDFDLFLGGAAGQPGRVIVWNAEQQAYKPMPQPVLDADRDFEDMGAVWLDVDNDRDLDLFVASGGNERAIDSEFYQPRLYLNDGSGKLTRSNEWLPQLRVSAGPVCAADIDQDGRVDLFVGGRQVPGRYPLPATSYFLRNTGNRFEDASETFFGDQLKECGMVSGAIFTDVDQDADLDLILAREWDHLLLLRNEANGFQDASAEAGLASFRGWWTGVTAFDCDDDGDLDYVATNLGQNTKYHASDAKPFRIYYGDFEGTGERKLVEAEYESDTLFPVRGKSCSTHAMPSLAEKFTTYKQFAAATLEEIYTPQCLDEAYQCSANTLSSVLIRNDGRGRFTFLPLPAEAQMSPGFGVVTQDFDGDGNRDVLMAQNFFSPQPETGNFDGGLGVLLRGHGDGTFEAVSPGDSGIVIPGDATAIVFNGNQFPQDKVAAIVAVNNDSPRWLAGERTSPQITVRFQDVTSAAEVAGGVLRVQFANGEKQVHEVSAGSGYLSQQPPVIMFTNPSEQGGEVIWTYHGESQKLNFTAKDREFQFPKR